MALSPMKSLGNTREAKAAPCSSSSAPSPDEVIGNFSFMIVEEFLKRRKMASTLEALRGEWQRPSEDQVMMSWYEMALKLRLPELVEASRAQSGRGSELTLLESLLHALVSESAVKTRRSVASVTTSLANKPAMQSSASLPALGSDRVREEQMNQDIADLRKQSTLTSGITRDTKGVKSSYIKRQHDSSAAGTERNIVKHHSHAYGNSGGVSSENWLPESMRFRSLHRELAAAKTTLFDMQRRERDTEKEMKRLSVTPLDHAKAQESLGSTHKITCGCCEKLFLHVNLPLRVSLKAILDIRIMWSGNLSSSTVFSALASDPPAESGLDAEDSDGGGGGGPPGDSQSVRGTGTMTGTGLGGGTRRGGGSGGVSKTKGKDLLSKCYDQVSVCVFCAQFFHEQEKYRPSFEAITREEKRQAYFERKQRELEYWDPLKMTEKDRELADERKRQQQQQQAEAERAKTNTAGMGDTAAAGEGGATDDGADGT